MVLREVCVTSKVEHGLEFVAMNGYRMLAHVDSETERRRLMSHLAHVSGCPVSLPPRPRTPGPSLELAVSVLPKNALELGVETSAAGAG